MEKPPPPTVVYYNSACPVCDAGIKMQQGRMGRCDIEWVDVHAHPQALDPLGLGLEDVRERLHVRDGQGRIHVGADALAALWSQTPRQRWLAWLARRGGWLGRLAYNAFARQLYRWNLRRGHWQPTGPAAPAHPDNSRSSPHG